MCPFGAHVWRRDPPCARRHNKEYLLNSLPTIESSIPVFLSINSFQMNSSDTPLIASQLDQVLRLNIAA